MKSVCGCSTSSPGRSIATGVAIALLTAMFAAGCTQKPVSFSASVFPVLQQQCGECHQPGGDGEQKSGFSVASYDSVIKGTTLGPVIVAGSATSSSLMRMVEHKTDPQIHMPHGGAKLSDEQIATLNAWIDQGAKNN